jgi:hypothetical protein
MFSPHENMARNFAEITTIARNLERESRALKHNITELETRNRDQMAILEAENGALKDKNAGLEAKLQDILRQNQNLELKIAASEAANGATTKTAGTKRKADNESSSTTAITPSSATAASSGTANRGSEAQDQDANASSSQAQAAQIDENRRLREEVERLRAHFEEDTKLHLLAKRLKDQQIRILRERNEQLQAQLSANPVPEVGTNERPEADENSRLRDENARLKAQASEAQDREQRSSEELTRLRSAIEEAKATFGRL